MKMRLRFPKAKLESIYHEFFNFEWPRIQDEVADLGPAVLDYMRRTIADRTRRTPASGNLARAMDYKLIDTEGKIHWGVGNIANLMSKAPYFYVVDTGKMITGQEYIPFHGNDVGGSFNGGRPSAGHGKARFEFDGKYQMTPQKAIRPMGYIDASRRYLKRELMRVMKKYRKK